MRATLEDLSRELGLRGTQMFDADLQDRLAYHLLKRRGYEAYISGRINRTEFGKRLAQEWASLPVLAKTLGGAKDKAGNLRTVERGQSFYAGDGLNKSLVTPERVEAVLDKVKAVASKAPSPAPSQPTPQPSAPAKPAGDKSRASGSILAAFALIAVAVVLFIIFGS
jgi:hypothetical protein